jgi:hypothetical protein
MEFRCQVTVKLKIPVQSGLRNKIEVSFSRDFFSAHEINEVHQSVSRKSVLQKVKTLLFYRSYFVARCNISGGPHVYIHTRFFMFRGIWKNTIPLKSSE